MAAQGTLGQRLLAIATAIAKTEAEAVIVPDKIVIAATLPGAPYQELLDAHELVLPADGVVMEQPELEAALPGATALVPLLIHPVDGPLLDRAPSLRIVANVAVGYDNVDVAAATARSVLVTNTPDVLTEATADLAWALMLGLARELIPNDRYLREGRYKRWLPGALLGADVYGRTLGIVGLGRIGQAVARRANGFGMRVLYHQPRRPDPALEASFDARWVTLEALLGDSDFVSLHCPLSESTRHLIDRAALARMKPTAYLVNTARGPVVDEKALAEALEAETIAGAGLDVYEHEPAVEPALLPLTRAVLLPHVGSATRSTREAMARLAVEAVDDLLAGRRPKHPVNPEVL
jgi:glyoxylate reductase